MRVIAVPAQFDEAGFEQFARHVGAWPPEGKALVDAAQVAFVSPPAMVGLITFGQALRELGVDRPTLRLPVNDDVRSYWAAIDAFGPLDGYFTLDGKVPKRRAGAPASSLVPVTPIRRTEDVHHVVEGLHEQASRLFTEELHLGAQASMRFAMALSEACQNIVEHAGTSGWVLVQRYKYRLRWPRRPAAVIAASDAGIGFRRSLEASRARVHGDRWSDAAALQDALMSGLSRFREAGRGQGLAGIKRFLGEWHGSLSVRSGTARLSIVREDDDTPPLEEALPFFPGSQLQVILPSRQA
ncbi:MAG: ATP-binding protein [Gemmatimonadales bacterium]|nr:ATP-binding protein [Gemmatimonadales bacterium]